MKIQGFQNNLIINRGNSLILCDRKHQKASFNVVRSIRILITCHCIPQTTVVATRDSTVRNMQILMFMAMMTIM
jgi:hypothetical protein